MTAGGTQPAEVGARHFGAAVVGLVFAQFVGANSMTIAKVWLAIYAVVFGVDEQYTYREVAEASLYVIYVGAGAGTCFGAFAAKRQWVAFDQVLTAIATAGVVVALAILDHGLPVPLGEERLQLSKNLYYLGWIGGLWFLPFCLLSAWGKTADAVRTAGGLLVVTIAMSMVGLIAGISVEVLAELAYELDSRWHNWMQIKDDQRFWVARPVTINTIGAAYVAVAFAPVWWPRLRRDGMAQRLWPFSVSMATVGYAGVFGVGFYEGAAVVPGIVRFVVFAVLPAIVGIVVVVSYGVTGQRTEVQGIELPAGRFWGLLPLGLALGLAAVALWGLAPLGRREPMDAPVYVMVLGHGLNGLLLGKALGMIRCAVRLIPGAREIV